MTKKELFENFQKNWMRLLSPFEIEDIDKWIDEDNMPVEVVNEALKETVIYNAPNL
ncbi:TPA: DnaD domain protein, partial [Streptococcus pyogenes]